ncbi:hypothetical protein BC629DRAFT_1442050 [Irpex lacteus]|nr:hypothetical protein BC629DRAFT_1442050 [Irpex lacteus]
MHGALGEVKKHTHVEFRELKTLGEELPPRMLISIKDMLGPGTSCTSSIGQFRLQQIEHETLSVDRRIFNLHPLLRHKFMKEQNEGLQIKGLACRVCTQSTDDVDGSIQLSPVHATSIAQAGSPLDTARFGSSLSEDDVYTINNRDPRVTASEAHGITEASRARKPTAWVEKNGTCEAVKGTMQAAEAAAADKNYTSGLGSAHTRTYLPRKVHYALPAPLVPTPLSPPICINVLRVQLDNLVDRVLLIARYLEASGASGVPGRWCISESDI